MIVTLFRLGIVAFAPAPYRDVLFERLADEFDLKVFYLHLRDSLRGWTDQDLGYRATTPPCWTPERAYGLPVLGAVNPTLTRELDEFQPDCLVLYGHAYWSHFMAMRWARRNQTPYLLRCDSNPLTLTRKANGNPVRLRAIKLRMLRRIAASAAGALTIGTANDEYWAMHDMPAERRFFAPMCVDNDQFRLAKRAPRSGPRTVIFVGRFIAKKNLERLLQAWSSASLTDARLVLAGSGPLERTLKRLAGDNVTFEPFKTQQELYSFYARADALILPSISEPWGLVANEAMAAGLPVLASDRCGCVADLVEDGVNGFVFSPDESGIADALRKFAALDKDQLARFGEKSAERISSWNYDAAIKGFREGVSVAVGQR